MTKQYPLDQSPLFKLRSHKRLAKILSCTAVEIRALLSRPTLYRKRLEGNRLIEDPVPGLKRIQKRVTILLSRIEHPAYLYSAVKGRSYRDNAEVHAKGERMVKTDIGKFFPNTPRGFVFQLFRRDFRCSPDVSESLSILLTCDGHLPTGGPASPILSYYANKRMFDGLASLSEKLGLEMSVYVDDITFSGERATRSFLAKVKKIVSSYGYKTHKDAVFGPDQVKTVTGVVLREGELLLPNRRHKNINYGLSALRKCSDDKMRADLMPAILGRLNEASQFDSRFYILYRTLRAEQVRKSI